jgi:8-amino-7-oxononanoate synthase
MPLNLLQNRISDGLAQLAARHHQRQCTPSVRMTHARTCIGETTYYDLSTNDYLGLATHQFDKEVASGFGSTGSRLLSGTSPETVAFESAFARWVGRPRGMLFNSGYHASVGIIPAVVGPGDWVIADRLVHASIWDGIRLSGAKWRRFQHNDMDHLDRILKDCASKGGLILIVTESVFSMDGDIAPLPAIVALAKGYGASIMVDEAHALGVLGPQGKGLVAQYGLGDDIDIWVAGLGKAWSGMGAMVLGSEVLIEWLINRARSFVFSTALPLMAVQWAQHVLDRMPDLDAERQKLRVLIDSLGGVSPIVPKVLGSVENAQAMSNRLAEGGFWVPVIRPPTVPPGTSRLRLSLSSALPESAVRQLVALL